jgi:hypothetical protein
MASQWASSRLVPLAAVCALLAACAVPEGEPGTAESNSGQSAATETKAIVQARPDEPAPPPVASTSGAGAGAGASASANTAVREVRASELIGLKGDQVTDLLGHPALVRRDSAAQVWQYRGRDCVLDVFLYPPPDASKAHDSAPSSERTVVYVELRGKDAKKIPDDRCFGVLMSGKPAG